MDEIKIMKEMLSKKVWAVVGANNNPSKYGNMIYNKLKTRGYEVYPVNPIYDEVEGDKCYNDLKSVSKEIDVIEMIVSPKRGKAFLEEAEKLGIKYIWLQPGTYDDEFLQIGEEKKLIMLKACVLVALI